MFQYCFIRVAMTITAMATQTVDLYCEDSLSPAFAHSWVMAFDSIAVTIAMYCLLAFYFQLKNDLARNSPMLKLLCIKLVIFFSFWQTVPVLPTLAVASNSADNPQFSLHRAHCQAHPIPLLR